MADKEELHTYADAAGHRVYRKEKADTICRRCDPSSKMEFVATTERKDGESVSRWKVRAIHASKEKVN